MCAFAGPADPHLGDVADDAEHVVEGEGEQVAGHHPEEAQGGPEDEHLALEQVAVPDPGGDVQGHGPAVQRQEPVEHVHFALDALPDEVGVEARQGLGEDRLENRQVHHHLVPVQPVEVEVEVAVQQVGEALEGVVGVHVQEQHGRDVGHALDVAHVGPVAHVRLEDVPQRLGQGPVAVEEGQLREGPRKVLPDEPQRALLTEKLLRVVLQLGLAPRPALDGHGAIVRLATDPGVARKDAVELRGDLQLSMTCTGAVMVVVVVVVPSVSGCECG